MLLMSTRGKGFCWAVRALSNSGQHGWQRARIKPFCLAVRISEHWQQLRWDHVRFEKKGHGVCVSMATYIYMFICVYIYIYIWAFAMCFKGIMGASKQTKTILSAPCSYTLTLCYAYQFICPYRSRAGCLINEENMEFAHHLLSTLDRGASTCAGLQEAAAACVAESGGIVLHWRGL